MKPKEIGVNFVEIMKKKTYQIECGKVQGIIEAESPRIAFRNLMEKNNWTKNNWGLLARFREVTIGWGGKIFRDGKWQYQAPSCI